MPQTTFHKTILPCRVSNRLLIVLVLLLNANLTASSQDDCSNKIAIQKATTEYLSKLQEKGVTNYLLIYDDQYNSIALWDFSGKTKAVKIFCRRNQIHTHKTCVCKKAKDEFSLILNHCAVIDFTQINCFEQAHAYQRIYVSLYCCTFISTGVLFSNCQMKNGDEYSTFFWELFNKKY